MRSLLIASVGLLGACLALDLEENRPGAIPILSQEVNDAPGGWAQVDLNDQEKVDRLVACANDQINNLQLNKPPGSPRHKVIKIKEGIQQVVAGMNCRIMFTVGQLNESPPQEEINDNGQYGQCYFKIFVPLNSPAQLLENTCVKIDKQDAV